VGDQQGGNNENNMPLSLVQETLDEGASSLKSVDDGDTFPRPPSPPPHATKMKSSDVDMFLKVLKNKPKSALVSGKKSSDAQVLKKLPASSSVGKTVTTATFRNRMRRPTGMSMANHFGIGGN
jgi:hypothetical protein